DGIGETVRVLLEHTGRLAAVVAEDRAAVWNGGVAGDPGAPDRCTVEPARVAIAAAQHGGMAGRHAIEVDSCRPAAPAVLIETATEKPRPLRETASERRDAVQRFF